MAFRRRRRPGRRRRRGALRIPVISPGFDKWRALRRWTSRSHWGRRLLRSQYAAEDEHEGLILIQIDGLSRKQFERAIRTNRMPFVRRVLESEEYELRTQYSGLPSTTSSVQGELFFGYRSAVPAHGFVDRSKNKLVQMLNPDVAAQIEERIKRGKKGLLTGGSAYCNIYTGGAAEPHFCASAMGWGNMFKGVHPWRIAAFLALHFTSLLRIAMQAVIQLLVAIAEAIRGVTGLKECFEEIKFIPKRIIVGVLMHEVMTICAAIDATRGLPLVQLNFLGYDEFAHHRGPESRFSQWSLRGIDRCIRKVWRAAAHSERRHYQVWIYSDHGQQQVTPYDVATGRLINDVVTEIFQPYYSEQLTALTDEPNPAPTRASYLRRHAPGKQAEAETSLADETPQQIKVAGIGPMGHIYLPSPLPQEQLAEACRQLATKGKVPIVLLPVEGDLLRAWTSEGEFELPHDAPQLFGDDHPFLPDLGKDLVGVSQNPHAGDILFMGWRKGTEALSFVYEKGAHGAAAPDECQAFVLLPIGTPLDHQAEGYSRPDEFYKAVMHVREQTPAMYGRRRRSARETLRVMTYNVHCCMGLDGRLSISRIARILAQCDADVIALQELDAHRPRSGSRDQAQELARQLGMEVHFHPAISVASEAYGDAVLSRLPMRLKRAAALPGKKLLPGSEPRGAVWVEVEVGESKVQILNTHLGLRPQERQEQIEALLGPDWLGHPDCLSPVILCGDLNAGPRSSVYRSISERLRDTQLCANGKRPVGTWLSTWPVLRIDHIFISNDLSVASARVPRASLMRVASDHLPLVVDIAIQNGKQ